MTMREKLFLIKKDHYIWSNTAPSPLADFLSTSTPLEPAAIRVNGHLVLFQLAMEHEGRKGYQAAGDNSTRWTDIPPGSHVDIEFDRSSARAALQLEASADPGLPNLLWDTSSGLPASQSKFTAFLRPSAWLVAIISVILTFSESDGGFLFAGVSYFFVATAAAIVIDSIIFSAKVNLHTLMELKEINRSSASRSESRTR